MAGLIPPQFIDDLLDRTDIVELVGSRVQLKKSGKEFQACCPFHDEKTPSFYVSPEKQFYHCFGCGAHGTAIGFLMDHDRMGFVEAVEELAQRAAVEVPREGAAAPRGPDNRPLYRLLEEIALFYQDQLRQPASQAAVDYLKARGLSGEIAAEFGIGFAPPGWDKVLKRFGADDAGRNQLISAGMLSEGDKGPYDRFRNRVMFPIRDRRGRVVGFGGRVLDDGKPKYLNSPETALFHKGRELYGLHEAIQANRKLSRLLVVEGYMDVVALAQFGVRNAVATLGTATTPDHLERIFRAVAEVVFCFDGDRAGRGAAWKALETALPMMREGRSARFLFLPEGEDPDTLVRQEGADAFRQRLDQAPSLSTFLFQQLEDRVEMETADGRARLAEQAKPLLGKLPPGVFRDLLQQELNQRVGVAVALPQAAAAHRPSPKPLPRRARGPAAAAANTPLRQALILLLQRPDLAGLPELPQEWRNSGRQGIELLDQLLDLCAEQPELRTAQLVERWRDHPAYRHLSRLAASTLSIPDTGLEPEFRDSLRRLTEEARLESLTRDFEQLEAKAREQGLSDREKTIYRALSTELARRKQGG